MHRSSIYLAFVVFVGLFFALLGLTSQSATAQLQTTPTPTKSPEPLEFYRAEERITTVQVVNPVRIRNEPSTAGGAGTIFRTAQIGEEFIVRQDVQVVRDGGYTWIPVAISQDELWIAQEGFLEVVTEMVQIPISQEAIDFALDAELPEGAAEVLSTDNQLQAVDGAGEVIAVWEWRTEPDEGSWKPLSSDLSNFVPEKTGFLGVSLEQISHLLPLNLETNPFFVEPGVRMPPDFITVTPADEFDDGIYAGLYWMQVSFFFVGVIEGDNPNQRIVVFATVHPRTKTMNYIGLPASYTNYPTLTKRLPMAPGRTQQDYIRTPDYFGEGVPSHGDGIVINESTRQQIDAISQIPRGTQIYYWRLLWDEKDPGITDLAQQLLSGEQIEPRPETSIYYGSGKCLLVYPTQ